MFITTFFLGSIVGASLELYTAAVGLLSISGYTGFGYVKRLLNRNPQLIIDIKGITTWEGNFFAWSSVFEETVDRKSKTSTYKEYLTFKYSRKNLDHQTYGIGPNKESAIGALKSIDFNIESIPIDELNISGTDLESLLSHHRKRYESTNVKHSSPVLA